MDEVNWEYLPSMMSFCLFKNQSGILYWRGLEMMVTIFSTWKQKFPFNYAQFSIKFHYLFFGALSSAFVKVNIGLLEDNARVAATDTLDGSHGDGNFAFTIDVGAHDTQNMLEFLG